MPSTWPADDMAAEFVADLQRALEIEPGAAPPVLRRWSCRSVSAAASTSNQVRSPSAPDGRPRSGRRRCRRSRRRSAMVGGRSRRRSAAGAAGPAPSASDATISPISVTMPVNIASVLARRPRGGPAPIVASTLGTRTRTAPAIQRATSSVRSLRRSAVRCRRRRWPSATAQQPDLVDQAGGDAGRRHRRRRLPPAAG